MEQHYIRYTECNRPKFRVSTSLSLLIDHVSIWHDIGHPGLYTKGDEFTLSMVPITIY